MQVHASRSVVDKPKKRPYLRGLAGLYVGLSLWASLAVGAVVSGYASQSSGGEGEWLGATAAALEPGGRVLYLACERSRQIVVLDLATRKVAPLSRLPQTPTGLVLSQHPHHLLVTCVGATNRILSLQAETGRILAAWPAGSGV
jgi:hypothetical protein